MSRADEEVISTVTAITGEMGATATVPTSEVLNRGNFGRMKGGDRRKNVSRFGTGLILDSVVHLLCVPSLNITRSSSITDTMHTPSALRV